MFGKVISNNITYSFNHNCQTAGVHKIKQYLGLAIQKLINKNVTVSCTFFVFEQCVGQVRKVHETTTLLLVTLRNIHRPDLNFVSLTDSAINLP